MTISDDLLAAGKVIQNPDDANSVIANVPHILQKAALDAGLMDVYASSLSMFDINAANWTPTIKDVDGNDIANPMSAFDWIVAFFKSRFGREGAQLIAYNNRQAKMVEAAALTAEQVAALV